LYQLLSLYLLFVLLVLLGGLGVNAAIEQQLQTGVQLSDQALAREIAVETSLRLTDAENAVIQLGTLASRAKTSAELETIFQTFQQTHSNDVEYAYWLDQFGGVLYSYPSGSLVQGAEFSPTSVVEQARIEQKHNPRTPKPVLEVGIASESNPITPGVIIAQPVSDESGKPVGIVAVNLSLIDLSDPVTSVVQAQKKQGRILDISVIDTQGLLVASPEIQQKFLWNVLNELPGASQALHGQPTSLIAADSNGEEWLYSAVPVPVVGWAVVVQRPVSEALAVVNQFHLWLLAAALLFALGGLFFWLLLLVRVIRPLHTLAVEHQTLPTSEEAIPIHATVLAEREDEMGDLARSLVRLERDGVQKLGELRTLLETSNAVVTSLDPYTVVGKIIREARRLVDVQAAAVLIPDERGVLRVLVSDGHSERYVRELSLSPENVSSSAVRALRDRQPVQRILTAGQSSFSYTEGFRTALAIPIISRHAGEVVLLVHRIEPRLFEQNEIDLLLTFANYATLAWEHAVLYERSDERLREVAKENELLYRQASEEKQTLEAIMGSMSDGLVLTGIDGIVLYANPGACSIVGLSNEALERRPISVLSEALCARAVEPEECERMLARVETSKFSDYVLEVRQEKRRQAIHTRVFDVNDEAGKLIGRGLLLRDVTRERELDEFKSALLAAVGHELRTPLAAIKGYASTLLQEDVRWPLADQRHFLQTISSESDRLAQLVSNLLDLSRHEAGLLLLNRSPVQLQTLVSKTVERLKHPEMTITVHIPEDLPLVDVDSGRVEVVLHNLIANALAYGEGEIHISAERREETVVVSVADNGPGIAAEELAHIFERFYRARRGRQRFAGGTGLGLAICKAFIEAHRGAIWVESSEQGTTISFSLPLALTTPVEAKQLLAGEESAYDNEDKAHFSRRG
jgi:PAS domain S-box-containing protein